jgi:hypothetical protein
MRTARDARNTPKVKEATLTPNPHREILSKIAGVGQRTFDHRSLACSRQTENPAPPGLPPSGANPNRSRARGQIAQGTLV